MRMTEKEYLDFMQNRRTGKKVDAPFKHVERPFPVSKGGFIPDESPIKKGGKQTKCEMEYQKHLECEFPGCKVIPWGIQLRMANGHKYTPDFLVMLSDKYLLVEVKQRGTTGFRQPSYQRAVLAFDQCRVEYTHFKYRLAEKQGREWTIKDY